MPYFVEGPLYVVRREPQRHKSFFGKKRLGALRVSLLVLDELVEVGAMGLDCLRRGCDGRLSLHIIQDRLGLGQ